MMPSTTNEPDGCSGCISLVLLGLLIWFAWWFYGFIGEAMGEYDKQEAAYAETVDWVIESRIEGKVVTVVSDVKPNYLLGGGVYTATDMYTGVKWTFPRGSTTIAEHPEDSFARKNEGPSE